VSERFQVDLAGMVDLLSRHLYSGPQVYLRELIQNAVDAVTARLELDPRAAATIRLSTDVDPDGDATLSVSDTGVGLTATEAAELLATIGRSSKRDPALGLGRTEFIGQFGIGLLAAFMVADRIEVRSRSARDDAPAILWEGRADGTFEVSEDPDPAAPVGTTVTLTARRDAAHWLENGTVLELAREYGSLLPFDIAVRVPVAGSAPLWRRIAEPQLPWRAEHPSDDARDRALAEYCERFTPLTHIDLDLPVAGLSGVAFVLPQAVSPGSGQHRVYTKRMLLGPRVDRVLPEWAFFTRAVLDTETLSPTASREQLHEDEVLLGVREALGEQLKRWALDTLRRPGPLAGAVLETHHLALRALALTDGDMLELVAEVLPFETTDGPLTLAQAARSTDADSTDAERTDADSTNADSTNAERTEIVYTTTTEAYRRVAAVARAQGLVVVNAGYVYDADIMQRLAGRRGWRARELQSSDLVHVLGAVDVGREMKVAAALGRAREVLAADDCDAIVRTFSPDSVPAILLRDSEGEHRRELDRERAASPDLWGGLLDAFAERGTARTRTLVLNDEAPVVRRLLAAPLGEVFDAGLRSLYLSAVMLAGEGLRSAESIALSDALSVLLDASLASAGTEHPPQEDTP
jgi:molecular chaperone HtpG